MALPALTVTPASQWHWWEGLLSHQSLACGAIALGSIALAPLLAGALWKLGRRDRGARAGIALDSEGTATLEFVLILPIILFLVLTLAQTTLIMGANVFVHYAAFAATRSAIVYIPSDQGFPESPNVVILDDSSVKFTAIRHAAVYALVPVAGRLRESDRINTSGYITGLSNYFATYGRQPPAWIDKLAADRLRYADANTRVSLLRYAAEAGEDRTDVPLEEMPEGSRLVVGPRDPVTVRVVHSQNLAVPYIGAIFADGRLDAAQGGNRYSRVSAQYTLTNEGIVDWLPPAPSLPRGG